MASISAFKDGDMKPEDRRHFERKVPVYAEPISANELKDGEVYFSVQFADEDMLVPIMETLVFTGRGLDRDGSTVLNFQDLDSYKLGIERGSQDARGAIFYAQDEKNLSHIFEYDRALDRLIYCLLRRQKRKL